MERHRTRLLLRTLLIVGCVIGLAWPGVAGFGYKVKCGDCDFEASVLYGGGIPGREPGGVVIGSGYCCSCDKFVRVFSDPEAAKEKDGEAGGPIGDVFCLVNGKKFTLYACPDCSKPFIAIRDDEFMKDDKTKMLHCPKCGKRSFSVSGEFIWD